MAEQHSVVAGETGRNVLFGVLALQLDLITQAQFLEACDAYSNDSRVGLPEYLVRHGWLNAYDRHQLERALERKLATHGGDVAASLAGMLGESLQQTLLALHNRSLRDSLMELGRSRNGTRPRREPPVVLASAGPSAEWSNLTPRKRTGHPRLAQWVAAVVLLTMAGVALSMFLFPPLKRLARAQQRGAFGMPPFAQMDGTGSIARQKGRELAQSLSSTYFRQDDVIRHLKNDAGTEPSIREAALEFVHDTDRWAMLLNNGSWYIVRQPGEPKEAYRQALEKVNEACRLVPDSGYYLNTLGVAQYRVGQYANALKTLTQSDKKNRFADDGPRGQKRGSLPADLAFLAMANFKLGNDQIAKDLLAELQRAVLERREPQSELENRAFLEEARQLIENGSKKLSL
jgi:hypothetical protein